MDTEQQVALIKQSSWFDKQWYLNQYPDVARLKMGAVTHFVRYGWKVGRNPSPRFHTRRYLEQHSDVARANINPLVHYLRIGHEEGRTVVPVPMAETAGPVARNNNVPNNHASNKSTSNKQLSVPASAPTLTLTSVPEDDSQRVALQLEQTQQLLEHYFKRCQELEYRFT